MIVKNFEKIKNNLNFFYFIYLLNNFIITIIKYVVAQYHKNSVYLKL